MGRKVFLQFLEILHFLLCFVSYVFIVIFKTLACETKLHQLHIRRIIHVEVVQLKTWPLALLRK